MSPRRRPPIRRSQAGNMARGRGTAGASAQRQFDRQEGRRRARLRTRWAALVTLGVLGAIGGGVLAAVLHAQTILFMAIGAIFPVLQGADATPAHRRVAVRCRW